MDMQKHNFSLCWRLSTCYGSSDQLTFSKHRQLLFTEEDVSQWTAHRLMKEIFDTMEMELNIHAVSARNVPLGARQTTNNMALLVDPDLLWRNALELWGDHGTNLNIKARNHCSKLMRSRFESFRFHLSSLMACDIHRFFHESNGICLRQRHLRQG